MGALLFLACAPSRDALAPAEPQQAGRQTGTEPQQAGRQTGTEPQQAGRQTGTEPTAQKDPPSVAAAPAEAYEVLLEKGPVSLGLAESRGADKDKIAIYTQLVFSDVVQCLATEHNAGRTRWGAARIAVFVDETAQPSGVRLLHDDRPENERVALLCLKVPALAHPMPFATVPPAKAAGRGFAVDLRW